MIIYLYVKQHRLTGLKYFGKTIRKNPFAYPGSGTRWKRHWSKHGRKYIDTIEIWGFDDQTLCTEFALNFSEKNNIVESNEWANLIPEDGLNSQNRTFTKEHKSNMRGKIRSEEHKRKLSENHARPMLGKKFSNETRQKMSENNVGFIGRHHSIESKMKTSASLKGRKYPEVTCPHCFKIGAGSSMKRYHFDNCHS